jgi:hypothetical protein
MPSVLAVFWVDHELERGRDLNRQVGRLFTLENSAHIDGRPTIGILQAVRARLKQ